MQMFSAPETTFLRLNGEKVQRLCFHRSRIYFENYLFLSMQPKCHLHFLLLNLNQSFKVGFSLTSLSLDRLHHLDRLDFVEDHGDKNDHWKILNKNQKKTFQQRHRPKLPPACPGSDALASLESPHEPVAILTSASLRLESLLLLLTTRKLQKMICKMICSAVNLPCGDLCPSDGGGTSCLH